MQPVIEKYAVQDESKDSELLKRLELVASKSHDVYDGAIQDFRNGFTLGPTKFDDISQQDDS
jgi:hypothetical protein